MRTLAATAFLVGLTVVGCLGAEVDESNENAAAVALGEDSGVADAALQDSAPADASAGIGVCASSFGDQLTPGFGRIDGTLVAIVRPVIDEQCAQPNRDHVIVQVLMNGAVYRMVVNVKSDRDDGDTRVRIGKLVTPLPEPAWQEGWHLGVALDYGSTLHANAGEFEPKEMQPLVSDIVSELHIGDKLSVYGFNGEGRPESAHKIHRNRAGAATDGAIVVGAATESPKFLLFHFDGQTF